MKLRLILLIIFTITAISIVVFSSSLSALISPGVYSVSQRVEQFGPHVRSRLVPSFEKIGVSYPPSKIYFIGLKQEKSLEVWVSDSSGKFIYLKAYPILGASGSTGPKLRRGDKQVPEGLYQIESLNPNSSFHLSLRINYPNEHDMAMAKKDGRSNLGGDIMIHGDRKSIGCLAMGDQAAEDLFVLAAETGISNVSVVLSPLDFRHDIDSPDINNQPAWTKELYASIQNELNKFTKQ